MVCETVQKNLLFYIEGLYQPGKRAEIESHLATCEACQRVLEQERAFLLLLSSSLSIAPAPAQLKSRIKSALEQNRKVRVARKPWFWLCPVVTASLGIMISFAGLYFYNRSTHLDWVVGAHLAVSEDASLLDIRTNNASTLNQWVSGQTGLEFAAAAPQFAYIQLQGGKVLDRHKHIVQIAFSSDQGLASLYMMPKESLSLFGPSINMKHLAFYPQKKKGHVMVAWSDTKADYVLVSRTEAGLNRGCLLCHSSENIQLPLSAFLINS